MSITTARITVLGVAMAMIALFAGGIFDVRVSSLLLAAIIPCGVALAMVGRRARLRLATALGSVVLATMLVVVLEGGNLGDFADAFVAGPRRLLSTDWPSPVRPDLVGTVALLIAALTAVACDLASRRRLHLLPLAPVTLAYALVTTLSAPLIRPWWLLAFLVVGAAFALLHPGDTLAHRLTFLSGERRLVPMLGVALGLTAALSVPLAFEARADPRDNEDPEQTDSILDPIEATLALRQIDPPIPVHAIETDDAVVPTHWRTAALDRYNGRRWSPELTLRPIGRTLGTTTGDTIDYTVTFVDDNVDLLPLPGPPIRVDALVDTDPERTIVRVVDVVSNDEVDVRAEIPPTRTEASGGRVAGRQTDDTVAGLAELAQRMAGDGTLHEQLDELERTLREEFQLQPDVQGGGLQQRLIEFFLSEQSRGTEEQFATGFVLLARALGVNARVATGFIIEPDATAGAQVLRSDDAAVWPEVQINEEWVAYDPVPDDVYSPSTPEEDTPRTQTPAAPQPPIQPPPEPNSDTDDETQQDDEEAATAGTGVPVWAIAAASTVTAIVLPVALIVALILLIKFRRRRRRLRAAAAGDRVRGAWATATDGLVDAGVAISASRTDREIAVAGRTAAAGAGGDLDRLAALSSAVSYGTPDRTEQMADDAVGCLGSIEGALTADRSRWQRLRWRLSLRSLRRRSASPVTA